MKKKVVLFLHIPKAGGTTLSDIIYLQEKTKKQKEQQNVKAKAIFSSGILYHPAGFIPEVHSEREEDLQLFLAHPDLRAVLGHFNFGFHERLDQPSTYITMMREPVGRVLSLFSFQMLVQWTKGNFWGVKIAENASVGDFVTKPPYQEIHNGQTRRIAGDWNPEVSDSL